jgi:Holliday junction resolvase RusA-like endonuclease
MIENEVLFHCVIPGRPGIKKNGKQIRFNPRTRSRFIASSDKYEQWALYACPFIMKAKKDLLINFPINFCLKVYLKNHQWEMDLSNALEGPQDLLQKCEVYIDDKLIHSLDGSRKIFNDPNERIEITITRLKN